MKLDFSQTICDLEGKPFKDGPNDLTLASVCTAALLQTYPDEPGLAGEEKYQRYALSTRIFGRKGVDVSVEEIAKMKTLIGKFFNASVVGPAYDILEGKATVKPAEPAPKKPRASKPSAQAEAGPAPEVASDSNS